MIVVSVIEVFGILGDDFSGLWSHLGVGLLIGYILHLNFHGGIEAVLTSKRSLIKSGLMYRFDCTVNFLKLSAVWKSWPQ